METANGALQRELHQAKEFAQKAQQLASLAEWKCKEENVRASKITSERVQLNMKLKATLTDASKAAQVALGARSWAQQAQQRAEELEHQAAKSSKKSSVEAKAAWPLPGTTRPRKKGPGVPDFESLASPRYVRAGLSREEMEIARSGRAGWVYRQNDTAGHGGVMTPEVSLQDFSQAARDVQRQPVPDTMMPGKMRHQEKANQLEQAGPNNNIRSPLHRPGLQVLSHRLAEIYKNQQKQTDGPMSARARRGDQFHSLGPDVKSKPLKPLHRSRKS